ncbi:DUF362 domain-containing protein [Paradesulfitobacterium aromaticivorans]
MTKPVVSLVNFTEPYQSLKNALDLCGGLEGLQTSDNILIKPNLVSWDFELPFPPFGVVTTSTLIGNLVRLLKEHGFDNLTIGEGPADLKLKDNSIFTALGYDKLVQQYGVKLVNFHRDSFIPVDYGDFKLSIAREALAADKIINVPVLKTHNQAKVSLGLKNLKGCLNRKSKMICHGLGEMDLMFTFPRIIEKLPVALTIIDGIYTLAKGPGPTGKALRRNQLIASRDPFACDLVGAELLGYRGEEVEFLRHFSERAGRSLDLADVEVKGENVAEQRSFIEYDWEWTEDNTGPSGFQKRGISGLAVRKYDNSLCTGCSAEFNPMLILLMSAYGGEPFDEVEVVSGKSQLAQPGFKKTILFGKCAYDMNKNNPDISHAVPVPGCPPDIKKFASTLAKEGILCHYDDYVKYRHTLFDRYSGKSEFDLSHWTI